MTITVKGREYAITEGPDAERMPYKLTGQRGAKYRSNRDYRDSLEEM
jgi:hypothetical protein